MLCWWSPNYLPSSIILENSGFSIQSPFYVLILKQCVVTTHNKILLTGEAQERLCPGFFWGLVTQAFCLAHTNIPDFQNKGGAQHKPLLIKQFRHSEPLISSENGGKPLKTYVPADSRRAILQTDPSKYSSLRTAMLTLFHITLWIIPQISVIHCQENFRQNLVPIHN